AHGVVEIEALVKVDAPVSTGSNGLTDIAAVLRRLPDDGARVVDATDGRVYRRHAKRAVPGFHGRARAFLQTELRVGRYAGRPRPRRGVALAVLARGAAQQFVHRNTEGLSFDVPERKVERAERMCFLASGRIEPRDVHLLPDRVGVKRI